MNHRERPTEVTRAIIEGNTATLSALGKKGGTEAAKTNKFKADMRALNEAERKEQVQEHVAQQGYVVNNEGEVLPPQ